MPYTSDHCIVDVLFSFPMQREEKHKDWYMQPIIKNWAPENYEDFKVKAAAQVQSTNIDRFAEKIRGTARASTRRSSQPGNRIRRAFASLRAEASCP